MLTNTFSGNFAESAKWMVDTAWAREDWWWAFPVVAETYDGFLNDIYGFHVEEKHVLEAINSVKVDMGRRQCGRRNRNDVFGFKSGLEPPRYFNFQIQLILWVFWYNLILCET